MIASLNLEEVDGHIEICTAFVFGKIFVDGILRELRLCGDIENKEKKAKKKNVNLEEIAFVQEKNHRGFCGRGD
jgi:hypothetical protein